MAHKGYKQTEAHIAKRRASHIARGIGTSSTKYCPSCKQTLSRDLFGMRKGENSRIYSRSYCQSCEADIHRKSHSRLSPERKEIERKRNRVVGLNRYHGITVDQYETLLNKQNGKCAICQNSPTTKALNIDHCHADGRIRGLLCYTCNSGLGMFKDNPTLLLQAIEYLDKDTGLISNGRDGDYNFQAGHARKQKEIN